MVAILLAPLRALGLVPPPLNRADWRWIGKGFALGDSLVAEQGNLLLGFGRPSGDSSPKGRAMRQTAKPQGVSQALGLV